VGVYCMYGFWKYCGGVVCGRIVCCDVIWGNGGHWVLKCVGFWRVLVALLGVVGVVVASIV
jgi:hypothetical protein